MSEAKRAVIWAAVSTRSQANEELYSLPAQETDGKKLAAKMGWDVIDILTVPGHSRRYIDIHECAADMAAQGINAFVRLMQHWRDRDFDVLIVRDGERFARTQTLHSHVTETTIDNGAIIYSLQDGEINEHNYRMWISMAGYKAAGDIDRLVQHLKRGVEARVRGGLPARTPPMSHRSIRNPDNGKSIGLEIVEDLFPLWRDTSRLLIEGVSYGDIELALADRFGHVRDDGTPWPTTTIHRLFFNPLFWGHTYSYPYKKGQRFRLPVGEYILEEGPEVPPGVMIVYNKHPAILDLALKEIEGQSLRAANGTPVTTQSVKEELKRRMSLAGNQRPHSTSMFATLIVCGECGTTMAAANARTGWKCFGVWYGSKCTQRKQVSRETVIAYLNPLLMAAIEGRWPEEEIGESAESRIQTKERDIDQLKKQIRTLIQKQARIEEESELSSFYDLEILSVNKRMKRLQEERDTIVREPFDRERLGREHTLTQLQQMKLDAFWKLPDKDIQQSLATILGHYRLLAMNGKIVRVAPVPVRKRPRRKE